MRSTNLSLALLLALGQFACLPDAPSTVTSVRVSADKDKLALGQTTTLSAVAEGEDGSTLADVTNTLTSSDLSVVTICGDGRCNDGETRSNCAFDCAGKLSGGKRFAIAVGAGKAIVRARAGGGIAVIGELTINVSCVAPTGSGTTHSGVISASETWLAKDGPHLITGDLTIKGSEPCLVGDAGCVEDPSTKGSGTRAVTLTIQSCSAVKVDPGAKITVGDGEAGALRALGGSDDAGIIRFEPKSSSPQPGHWQGLILDNRSSLDATVLRNVQVAYAGGSPATCADDNAAIRVVGGDGTNTSPVLDNVTINDSAGHGVTLGEFGGLGPQSRSIVLVNAACNPFKTHPAQAGTIPRPEQKEHYVGNPAEIQVTAGQVPKTSRWSALGIAYHVVGDISVGSVRGQSQLLRPFLSLAPAVVVKFDKGTRLTVGPSQFAPGGILAGANNTGILADPVLLTSAEANPAAGDWVGLVLGPGAGDCVMRGVTIEYAGASALRGYDGDYGNEDRGGLIVLNPQAGVFEDNLVKDSAGYGIVNGFGGTPAKAEDAACAAPKLHPCDPKAAGLPPARLCKSFTGSILPKNCRVWKNRDSLAFGAESQPNPMTLKSDAFNNGQPIPTENLCIDGGKAASTPQLAAGWVGDAAPANADQIKSYAVLFTPEVASEQPWLILDLPTTTTEIAAGLTDDASKPSALSAATIVGDYGSQNCLPKPDKCKNLTRTCQGILIIDKSETCPPTAERGPPPERECQVKLGGVDRAERCFEFQLECRIGYEYTLFGLSVDKLPGAPFADVATALAELRKHVVSRTTYSGRLDLIP